MKALLKRAMKMALRIAPVAFLPWEVISPQTFSFPFWGSKLKRNMIDERVHQIVLESNSPCEDRRDVLQLKSIEGYAAAVYDGHGGWQVSDLCSKELLKVLDDCLSRNKEKYSNVDDLITQSIKQAFLNIESRYILEARIAYDLGFGRAARVGSCALVCVVHDNKLYCGNSGDSKGIVIQENKPMGFVQINRFLNADNPDQQKRLKQLYPNQEDIVVCKRPDNTSCYVKGRLQPTRSIGDLRLKLKQFNNPKGLSKEHQFQPPLKNFSGNYITVQPEIKIIPLSKKQKWVLLASDGLWDELGIQEVAQTFKDTPVEEVPSTLIQKCLEKVAQQNKMTVNQVKAMPQGSKKRKIHDDISIVVLNLEGQVK